MRFRLIGLFGFVTLAAVVCGIVFALPMAASFLALTFLLGISPGAWISGAVFSRGGKRAFFLGGLLSGVAPFTIVAITTTYVGVAVAAGGFSFTQQLGMNQSDVLLYRFVALGVWLIPGLFALSGGALAWLTYRIVRPANKAWLKTSGTESSHDY